MSYKLLFVQALGSVCPKTNNLNPFDPASSFARIGKNEGIAICVSDVGLEIKGTFRIFDCRSSNCMRINHRRSYIAVPQ